MELTKYFPRETNPNITHTLSHINKLQVFKINMVERRSDINTDKLNTLSKSKSFKPIG